MPSPADKRPTDAGIEPQFSFLRFAVRRASFSHVAMPKVDSQEPRPDVVPYNLQINAQIRLLGVDRAEVVLSATVTPDPRWMPYHVETDVAGTFIVTHGTQDHLVQFCKFGVPPILFPYVREMVHRLTTDGGYGAVRLDPMNIQQMLNASDWAVSDATDVR